MEGLKFFLPVICFLIYTFMTQGATPNEDLDIASLRTHVVTLEQTVTSLQSQSQTQEQKYSAVLSSVLSKLTGTTDELKDVKTELGELQNNYKELQSELETVKAQLLHNEESLIANISLISDSLRTEMNVSEEQLSSEITKLNSVVLNLKATLNVTDRNLKNVQREVGNMTDVIGTTLTRLNLTKQEIDNVSSQQRIFETEIREDVLQLKSNVSDDIHLTQSTNQVIQDMSDKLKILQTNVAFEVTQTGNTVVPTHGFIKFNYIKYSNSNAYSLSTGKFTTPIDGTYMFWFNAYILSTNSRANVLIQSTRGGIGIAYGKTDPGENFALCTGITVAFLRKGEEVWLNNTKSPVTYGGLSLYGGTLLAPAML